ncbi:MAG: MBL fold metallo-hydrolase [Desulfobacterales bacterium]|nr:MBL fold metallo-hydrolase [Desulfobacterales bacterium]
MNITFLGTGSAWGLPEINCDCLICRDMKLRGETRERSAFLLSGRHTTLLVDCGPDIRSQLLRHNTAGIDAVLISHEHGDHYMGLDDLFAYKRTAPRDAFTPIPVYVSAKSWEVIAPRFGYLEDMEVIRPVQIEVNKWLKQGEFEIFPFKTNHGSFAKGSVGFVIKTVPKKQDEIRIVYTSDFFDLPGIPQELYNPDYLIIQSFWLNEPVNNRPRHMSFQRAIPFIERLKPKNETFLVHMGDADMVINDPANIISKKYKPKNPLRPPSGKAPYPVPLNQAQWQETVDQIMSDLDLPYKITVAYDDLNDNLP